MYYLSKENTVCVHLSLHKGCHSVYYYDRDFTLCMLLHIQCVFFYKGNGQEDVVCCSWDGQTYIVNHGRQVVRFNFMENVAAFATGNYQSDFIKVFTHMIAHVTVTASTIN